MASSNFPHRHDISQAPSRITRPPGFWRLGMPSTMSPSLVASTPPSSDASVAFTPPTWGPSIHHSTSTPQMLPSNFGAGEDGTSSRLNSGPSAFATQREQTISGMTPGSQTRDFRPSPRTDGEQSQRDHVLYQADNYGSPNRYVGKSPNPNTNVASSVSRNHRPEPLGFGNIGDGLRINDQQIGTGPKSAPAQVKSFGEHANNDRQQGMNENLFDDRWLQHPEEIPDTSAIRHSAAFTDLLHAQLNNNSFDDSASRGLGPLGVHSASQAHVVSSPSVPPGQINDATSRPYVGHGYETLKSYVEVASSGRAHTSVAELDQLMSTLIELRGDGDTLPSMNHYDRDNLRQFLYQRVFGTTDGSSRLSRANPSGLIVVAGALVSRQHLHDEIIHFLEDQLDSMTSSPGLQRARAATRESHQAPTHNHNPRQFGAARDVIALQENEKGRPGFVPSPSSGVQGRGQTVHLTSPVPELQGLSLEEPQPSMATPRTHQPLTNVGIAPVPHLPLQQHVQFNPFAQGFNPGPQGLSHVQYGPSPIDLQHQQYLAYLHYQQQQAQQSPLYPPNLVISRNGMVSGPNPLMAPSVTFVPGRPGMAQNGPILPYGPQFLPGNTFTGPQFAGPMMPGNFMPNSPMSFGPFPQSLSSWSAPRTQHSFTRQSQFPSHMQLPTSRTSSPANHSRRPVVPVVPSLPYRAGSDDMYPVSVGGMSVRLQELTRDGQPSCAKAFDPRYLPFVENAREAKVAEWGVMKISNIPYSVTKQEIYGLLGRNAKIVTPDLGVGIHIIMERPTGKTQDCFVEFFSYGDAITAIHRCSSRGPNLRLGDRVVTVTMSSQDELMGEMFPRAKNCTWRDGRPVISESEEAYNTGFKSFLTAEELLQMVTHAEKPHRSNFTQKCLQRPFECMISTLAKFPWFAVDRYTIKTRDEMFKHTLRLITLLADQLNRGNEGFEHNLSESLLTELLYAGLNAPAFSEQQRWQLCRAAHPVDQRIRMSPIAPYWPFDVLGRKAGMDEDLVKFYAGCLKSHHNSDGDDTTNPYFGTWTTQSNEALGLTTVGQIGAREMEMVEKMLREVLP